MKVTVKLNSIFRKADSSKKRYIILKGSAGSGKSADTALNYILRLMKDKGRNLMVLRKSDICNKNSTFAELCSAISSLFSNNYEKYWKINYSDPKITCLLNGNQIIFRGMNDERQREKLKSVTFSSGKLTDVWLEEATEFSQADFEIVDDRLRGQLPNGQFYQIRMTFNPVNANHWIKKVFFDNHDPNVLTHHSTYLDNRFIDDAYRQRMDRRKKIDPDGYKIYGLGQWGELEGLILNNWQIAEISKDFNDYDDIAIGQDFGFNHADAILVLGIKDDNIYILSEIYKFYKDTAELIEIAEKMNLPKNKEMWCDSAEPDRIKMWKKAGFRAKAVIKEKSQNIKYQSAQIDWLKQRKIFIHPSCVNLIKELKGWRWKKDEKMGCLIDEPIAINDDAVAALRYGIERWRKQKKWLV